MNTVKRGALAGLLAAVAALVLAPAAMAAITSSQVTSPADPSFAVADYDAPNTIAVAGTTDGTAGDKVDLRCYYEGGSDLLVAEVAVEPDGSFSEPAAELANIAERACRLRAVPAGSEPVDPSPFAGPVMATGARETFALGSGPNAGAFADYFVWGQQLTAAAEYVSAGACGISEAFLVDGGFESTASTFQCNDYWDRFNAFPHGGATRSEIQVDGENAYLPAGASSINSEASGFPALTYSYSQNPLTGDLTIEETDPLVKCPDPEYPPSMSSCESFESAGVRVDRTIEQTEGGHLMTISDRFVSTDGKPHSLDLLPENDQTFGGNGEQIAYRFPGEASYSTHAEGENVSFGDATPGTVYIEVEGSPDGDPTTGRGAIVFDHPSSPAHFKLITSSVSEFFFNQSVDVPPGGSTRVRFAYVHAYTQAEVDALVQQAVDSFEPPPPVPPAPPVNPVTPMAPTPAATIPSNRFRLRKPALNRRRGIAKIPVGVPGAGTLILTGKQVRKVRRRPARGRTVVLKVIPKPRFAKKLRRRGRLTVLARITFRPTGGAARTKTRKLKLRRKR